jgi:single-strand DNA-binding protein
MSTSISILGNTGREVELRYTPQGLHVANFSMASNTVRNTPEGKQKKTDWFNITAFGKVAETLARNLRKGSQILVQGKLTFNPWLSRDGEPRVGADVILQDFEFAGGPSNASRGGENGVGTEAEVAGEQMQMEAATDESDPDQIPAEMIEALHTNEAVAEPYAGQF